MIEGKSSLMSLSKPLLNWIDHKDEVPSEFKHKLTSPMLPIEFIWDCAGPNNEPNALSNKDPIFGAVTGLSQKLIIDHIDAI